MQIRSIKFNFFMNFILKISGFIFPLITFPYVSRILSPEGIGRVSFATSVISYFQMFAALGIHTQGLRLCAKVRDDKTELSRVVHELATINVITTVISYIVFVISIFVIDNFREQRLLLMVTSITIIFSTFGFEWMYSALEQYKYITVRSLLFKVLSVIALFVFVHKQDDYIIYAMITVFASVGSNIFNLINIRKYIYLKPVGNYNLKQHVKPILVLFAMSAAGSVYTHLDTVMLGFMSNNVEVGYYSAAIKMKNVLLSMIVSLGGVLLPRLSYYIQTKREKNFLDTTSKAFNVILYMSIPTTIYFCMYAKECIIFLSGNEFIAATPAMQVIMPTIIFIGLTNMMGYQILVPLNKEKLVLISTIAGAVVDIILNAIFIPFMGALGASIGTLAAEFVVLIMQLIFLKDYVAKLKKMINVRYLIMPILISTLAAVIVKLINFENTFVALAVSATIFWGIYAAIFYMEKEPITRNIISACISFLKNMFKKKRDT